VFSLTVDDEIKLSLLEERHAETLFTLIDANRVHLREWLIWVDHNTSPDDSKLFIRMTLERFAANNGFGTAIFFRNQLAGLISYIWIDWPHRSTEIGYWLGEAFQGQGIMTRACRFLVDHAFDELKLNRVQIRCAVGNTKSQAIPERLGFTNEGTLRQAGRLYGRFVDIVIYSTLADEWQRLRRR
jgi:ribosomal-protein-serine acetyltransferase